MSTDYDSIIIGAGPTGEVCAGVLADAGQRVAIVERELVGGECSYWACIPSKTLLRPGEALAAAGHAPGAREAVSGPVDVPAALAWRDFMVSDHTDAGAAGWLTDHGIDLHRGSAVFTGPGTLDVGGTVLTADDIVVATGSVPILPPVDGLDGLAGVWGNREATGLTEVPRRLLVLGGGAVGVEMAQAVRRLGGEVALVEGHEHLLAHEPRAAGEALGRALAADGVELHLGVHASAARRDGDDFVLDLPGGVQLRGDRLLVATGRRPNVAGLGLERVGVQDASDGIPVDDRMSAGPGLWAFGDVAGIWPLTYVGKYQARIAAANILGGDRRASYDAVPRVVFCDPQVAAVGEATGILSATTPLSGVARTATYTRDYADQEGFLTLVSDGEVVTGAYAVGPEAGEWLQQATLAIRARVPLETLRDTIQPFPTFSESYVDAVEQLLAAVPAAA